MKTHTTPRLSEVYMQVIDPKRIEKLLVIQGASRRELATAAGWRSHSIVNRLIDGKVKTVTPERAARIARFFGVGIDDLFVARLSSDAGPSVKPARRRVA